MNIKQDETLPGSEAAPAPIVGSSSSKQSGRVAKRWRALQRWLVHNTFTARFLAPPLHHPVAGYVTALLTQSMALMLVALFTRIFPAFNFPFILFVIGPLLVALNWGVLPSIAAIFIGGVMLVFFLLPPYFSLAVAEVGDMVGITLYFLVGFTISILASRVQQAREQAELLAARLSGILQAIPDPVLLYDIQGRPTQLNRASKLTYAAQDTPVADLLSQFDIRSGDGKPLTVDTTPLARALRGESVIGEEIYYSRIPDRRDDVLSVSIAPIRSADGRTIEGAVAVLRDLTERVHAEKERTRLLARAQSSEYRFQHLFEAITDGVMVYDADGYIVKLNTAARMQLSRYVTPEALQCSLISRAEQVSPQSAEGDRLPLEQVPLVRILRGETISGAEAADVRITSTFDGEELWLNMSGTPLRDEQGKITGAISIGRDVTERRRLEQRTRTALEALLEMAQVLVQGAQDMPEVTANTHVDLVYSRQVVQRLADLTTRVLDCQRLAFMRVAPDTELLYPLAVMGLSPEQEEQWWREQEEQQVRLSDPICDPVMVARLRANEVLLIDLTQPPYDQVPNPYGVLQMLVAPMMLDNRLLGFLTLDYGGLEHIYTPEEIALTKAVTRLAALAMERDRLLVEAAHSRANELAALAANQLKDEFIGIAGHELRTPLTSMKINVQLATRQLRRQLTHYSNELEKAEANGGVREVGTTEKVQADSVAGNVSIHKEIVEVLEQQLIFLARMRRRLDLQNRLVQDLLDVSRLERGQLELRRTEFDLSALVREVIAEQQDITSNRTLQLDLPQPAEAMLVTADRDRISQVISNYLSNALKYSDADKPVSICVEQVSDAQQARVAVIDQGSGLSIKEQQHVWERFYRSPDVEVRSGSGIGLGLGLSISRTIIEQHNGHVGVESQAGEGATFWFTLPL